jgi:hypothetical protein
MDCHISRPDQNSLNVDPMKNMAAILVMPPSHSDNFIAFDNVHTRDEQDVSTTIKVICRCFLEGWHYVACFIICEAAILQYDVL